MILLAQALGQRGDQLEAAKVFSRAESRHGLKSTLFAPELALAKAWSKAARGDTTGAISDTKQTPSDVEQVGSDAKQIGTDAAHPVANAKQIPKDVKGAVSDTKQANSDPGTVKSDVQQVAQDAKQDVQDVGKSLKGIKALFLKSPDGSLACKQQDESACNDDQTQALKVHAASKTPPVTVTREVDQSGH